MMRKLLLSLLLLASPLAVGQMTAGYSSYNTDGIDSTGHIFVTLVVDGATNINLPSARHTGHVTVTLNGVTTQNSSPPVLPNAYLSTGVTNTLSNTQDGVNYTANTSAEVTCTQAGVVFLFTTASILSRGTGTLYLKNLSGATGIPGSCITKGGIVELCDWEVVAYCTNTPTWTTNAVTDAPPGYAGWYTNYWCLFSYGHLLICRPNWGSAQKTTFAGPAYCNNPLP